MRMLSLLRRVFGRRVRPSDPLPAPLVQQFPAKKKGISPEAVAVSLKGASDDELKTLLRMPDPMPGVIGNADRPVMAMDDATEMWAIAGLRTLTGEYQPFRGYPYLAELAQRPEYRRPVEILAKEMTRKWIKLHSKSGNKSKNVYLGKLKDAMDDYGVQETFRQMVEHDGFFGRGQIYIDTGMTDFPDELKTQLILDPRKIRKGGLKGIKTIEPLWTYPGMYNASNPLKPNFYKPDTWWVQGQQIHASRFLKMSLREVPDLLKPSYMFGGLPLTQMAESYVNNWLKARKSVSDLMNAFSVMVFGTNMDSALGGEDGNDLGRRVQMFNNYRNNKGTFVIDKETETLENISAPLGGLDKLQAQAQEHMASVWGTPLVILFGITPTGLNASSDGEIRVFYDWIRACQVHAFSNPLRTIIDIIQLSAFGAIDPDVTFTYEALWEPTNVEQATVRKTNAETAAIMIGDGIIAPEEERQRLATEDDGIYDGLDLTVVITPPEQMEDPTLGLGIKEPKEQTPGLLPAPVPTPPAAGPPQRGNHGGV